MNQFLVVLLRKINALVALAIVVGAAIAGASAYGNGGLIVGAIAGLLAAAVLNGVLAILLEIESHLKVLKEALAYRSRV